MHKAGAKTLKLVTVNADCDNDCLLVMAIPAGPTCHRNTDTCFDGDQNTLPQLAFLASLERLVAQREASAASRLPVAGSGADSVTSPAWHPRHSNAGPVGSD